MWQEAKDAFPSLLAQLEPSRIVVLGTTMWSMMPESNTHFTDEVQSYQLPSGKNAVCWALDRPSRGLSWAKLAAVIQFACERELKG
jgi:hypothetical protein